VSKAAVIAVAAACVAVLVLFWVRIARETQGFFGFYNGGGNGSHYLFWSGAGSDLAYLSFLAAGITLYRRHNCQKAWCPRIGKFDFTDPKDGVSRKLCWLHHPDVKHKTLHSEHIRQIQHRQHLYLGKKPGRG
jgi:hypothetical protein